jgi:hypothetical protein
MHKQASKLSKDNKNGMIEIKLDRRILRKVVAPEDVVDAAIFKIYSLQSIGFAL